MKSIENQNVLMIATNGFQEDEFFEPLEYLREQGATVHVASMTKDAISAGEGAERSYTPDLTFDEVTVANYDGLIIPGGLQNPDTLRGEKKAVDIVREFAAKDRIIAAVCHGPWLLVEADIVKGRDVTSYNTIKTDLKNAGANWHDQAVVTDNGIITSRSPEDLKAFNEKIVEELREGRHERDVKRAA